ncbi:TrmH family RNA methyltransferase [Clostridium acetobutylicum]|uniref:rRNA methylase, YSGA B.subtilis ortholog n=1 Tax=Clostridium acetobutylicum (strain ATCC 824 / DSM 792 / JCM 1419 / IAM 19013 / LMG 5710 / NBRC 13948 / NRRL B-527 / VKM B-1787 / 2291 / W) TaxID=272562 RepID=Q97GK8_CLOAB|nr:MULTISPECIES: RNA methyltransferase [Clostridium]AAK80314.1 RRNA methylase, YSGA B.subtilis ortholog [Clostridium acetobutylicum ATCC 824]ADZ21409.1 RRNA methylase [Clostridium acetobutylicum EA 2018]AEI33145.1 rRNA methylase [Clostridium acetobutylicum DSM 1731]AWV79265.1 RNA methyltransferase [Clostridium acetobutylicum]KHD38492.1 RNA methyltransferase [Clostridium acetobutylicum]
MDTVIKSKENSIIKEVKKLNEKKHRDLKKSFIVEGLRFVREALESDFKIQYLFVSEKNYDKFILKELKELIKKEFQVIKVTESILKDICNTQTPQGIVAVVQYKEVAWKLTKGFYMLVDKVQDPGNMGTIIRTANAAGALGVIITKGTVDIYNNKTLRATMGSIFKIPIIFEDDNFSKIKELKKNGFKIIASSLDTEHNFYDVSLNEKLIIAVGNEGNGISDKIVDISDTKVKIPMPGNVESLNVGVAAAIMMFEYVRKMM